MNHFYRNVPCINTCHCYKISHDLITFHVITLQSKGKYVHFPFVVHLGQKHEKAQSSLCRTILSVSINPGKYSQSRFTWLNNLRGTRQSWQQRQSVWRPILPIKTLHGQVSKSFKMVAESTNNGNMLIYMKQNHFCELARILQSNVPEKLKYPRNVFVWVCLK